MSQMSNLVLSLQEDILAGKLTFAEIAAKYDVPLGWVDEVVNEMIESEVSLFPEPTAEDCMEFDRGWQQAKDESYFDSMAHLDYLD